MTDKIDLKSNTQLISVKKLNTAQTGFTTKPSTFQKMGSASDITNNLIKENTNEQIRRDFFNTAIVKKGKKHHVTWIDKTKDVKLTNIEYIESYKSYNLEAVKASGNIINNKYSATNKDNEEESVRCKCLIF